jgi:hypothetical protein
MACGQGFPDCLEHDDFLDDDRDDDRRYRGVETFDPLPDRLGQQTSMLTSLSWCGRRER